MNNLVQEAAEREINRAITADEHANAHYYQILRRFISSKSAIPDARLDAAGLKEIDAAWLILHDTGKNPPQGLYEALWSLSLEYFYPSKVVTMFFMDRYFMLLSRSSSISFFLG